MSLHHDFQDFANGVVQARTVVSDKVNVSNLTVGGVSASVDKSTYIEGPPVTVPRDTPTTVFSVDFGESIAHTTLSLYGYTFQQDLTTNLIQTSTWGFIVSGGTMTFSFLNTGVAAMADPPTGYMNGPNWLMVQSTNPSTPNVYNFQLRHFGANTGNVANYNDSWRVYFKGWATFTYA